MNDTHITIYPEPKPLKTYRFRKYALISALLLLAGGTAMAAVLPIKLTKTETRIIPYQTIKRKDTSLARGKREIIANGQVGKELLTYDIVYRMARFESKRLVKTQLKSKPIDKVVMVGAKPITVKIREIRKESIPFETHTETDSNLLQGTENVTTAGKAGEKNIIYEVTYADGVKIGEEIIGEEILSASQNEIVAVGTKPQPPLPEKVYYIVHISPKYFHRPSCSDYNLPLLKKKGNARYIRPREYAIAMGYTPCPTCKP